jgi:hypothetical protein
VVGIWSLILVSGVAGSAEAASCGDTAGPLFRRVPCACGDTVITSTWLRATDPVVTTHCSDSAADGLTIGANGIILDCRGLTVRGTGLTGIIGKRDGVTVKNCVIEAFTDGIQLDGHGNRLLGNTTRGTFGGILVGGDDVWLVGNRAHDCLVEGLFVQSGRRAVVWNNRASRCFDGFAINGEKAWVAGNAASANGRHGFRVIGSDNDLLGNSADHNGDAQELGTGHGVAVAGSGNLLFGNRADNSEGKGFCVVAGNIDAGFNRARDNGESPEIDFDCPLATLLPDLE